MRNRRQNKFKNGGQMKITGLTDTSRFETHKNEIFN